MSVAALASVRPHITPHVAWSRASGQVLPGSARGFQFRTYQVGDRLLRGTCCREDHRMAKAILSQCFPGG